MPYPWTYDENIQVGTDYADVQEVLAYDRDMASLRDVAAEVEIVANALLLDADSTVWEIGTGTGEMALGLAARCSRVWATDVSPAMLEAARKKASARGLLNAAFGSGGFLDGFSPDHTVDGVVTQLALHHLPDFWKVAALRRIRSFLAPEGRLFLKDVVFRGDLVDYDGFFSDVVDQLRATAGNRVAGNTIAHIREEYSTFDWILEEMLARTGFRIVDKVAHGFPTDYTCVAT